MLPEKQHEELFYQIALTMLPGIGAKTGRGLLEHFGSAVAAFKAPLKELKHAEGIGEVKARVFRDAEVMQKAEKELSFIVKNNITPLYYKNGLPQRLENCADAPLVLFYKGNANLNAKHVVAIVGTRKNTDYGVQQCEELVEGLKALDDVLIVSGLAMGIDAVAHKKCVTVNIPTVGVLGHGLDRIYPHANKPLAKQMEENGGLLTEFVSGTNPDRGNFPMRNRIVAGMSDVTVVVESPVTGGALLTAYMASGYNRDVAAYPGRVTDSRSAGCNELIRKNVAGMITGLNDLIDMMNWGDTSTRKPVQRQLFLNLPPDEESIYNLLRDKDFVHSDELLYASGLNSSLLAANLLSLEMQGLVKALPGKIYRLV